MKKDLSNSRTAKVIKSKPKNEALEIGLKASARLSLNDVVLSWGGRKVLCSQFKSFCDNVETAYFANFGELNNQLYEIKSGFINRLSRVSKSAYNSYLIALKQAEVELKKSVQPKAESRGIFVGDASNVERTVESQDSDSENTIAP